MNEPWFEFVPRVFHLAAGTEPGRYGIVRR